MPTPFTHLEITQRLLQDTEIPLAFRDLLSVQRSAFQLGSVVADARVANGVGREVTHFYDYRIPMPDHPWRVMFADYPILNTPKDDSHLAFLAGYVAHLLTDEVWTLKMVKPKFFDPEWEGVDPFDKFVTLHLLLIYMDERDEVKLESWQADELSQSRPNHWLPFIPDSVLCSWRDLIADQIKPEGDSQTLNIFGKRLKLETSYFRGQLDNPDVMLDRLWRQVPQSLLEIVETQVYKFTRDQLIRYLMQFD